jgi:hypothetical protein
VTLALLLIGSLLAVTGASLLHPALGLVVLGVLCIATALDLNRPDR